MKGTKKYVERVDRIQKENSRKERILNIMFPHPYQAELAQFLRGRFPNTAIEDQRLSSRPDITVDGIAIEVKGPTNHRELDAISGKYYRYSKDFPKGLIIVLFNVMVNPYFSRTGSKELKKRIQMF